MLYGILTEWDLAEFDGAVIHYESVNELAFRLWTLHANERYRANLLTPDGVRFMVDIESEFINFRIGLLNLQYQVLGGKAIRLPF